MYLISTLAIWLHCIDSIYKKKERIEMIEILQYGIPYLIMPALGVYVAYEFVKMLILSYKEKNGKN